MALYVFSKTTTVVGSRYTIVFFFLCFSSELLNKLRILKIPSFYFCCQMLRHVAILKPVSKCLHYFVTTHMRRLPRYHHYANPHTTIFSGFPQILVSTYYSTTILCVYISQLSRNRLKAKEIDKPNGIFPPIVSSDAS